MSSIIYQDDLLSNFWDAHPNFVILIEVIIRS